MSVDLESGHTAFAGRTVRLRQITSGDYEALYRVVTSPEAGYRWRFRALTPAPEEFARMFWNNVLVQFAITDHVSDRPRGVVTAYSANTRDRWVFLAIVVDGAMVGTGQGLEASALMIRYLFSNWDFRKIYAEVPEFNMPVLKNAIERFMSREGTCNEHFYHDDVYWDVHTYAVTRARWEDLCQGDPLLADLFRSTMVRSTLFKSTPDRGSATAGAVSVNTASADAADIDAFLQLLATRMELSSIQLADSRLCEDAGMDSLMLLELADLVDELAGGPITAFDSLGESKSWTFRDLYLHYCAMSQTP